jgi:Ca2+-binding RTX toxin-like protein
VTQVEELRQTAAGASTLILASDAALSDFRTIDLSAAGTNGATVTLAGVTASVTVITGAGNDTLTGGAGADRLQGEAGDDLFVIASSSDHPAGETLVGGAGSDMIRYTSTAGAVLTLAAGVDVEEAWISNAAGSTAGTTAEGIDATLATVTMLTGNDGANTLTGNGQANVMAGGAGADTITGGAGADTIAGGAGDDVLRYASSSDFIGATAGMDAVIDSVGGDAGHDRVEIAGAISIGASGADTLARVTLVEELRQTSAGASTLILGSDAALSDFRTIDLAGAGADAVMVDLTGVTVGVTVIGGAGTDSLAGGGEVDSLSGGAGGDTLSGGGGADVLRGAEGADTFVLLASGLGGAAAVLAALGDTVVDFEDGDSVATQDILRISAGALAQLDGFVADALGVTGDAGPQGPNFLVSAAGAVAADQPYAQLIFDPASGILSFDPDGKGAAPVVLVARVSAGATLSALDLMMVV